MPDADQKEDNQDGQGNRVVHPPRTHNAGKIPTKRSENHVSHVMRKRNMPSIPEVLNTARLEWIFEILGYRNSDQPRCSDRYVAKSGKVTVEIKIVKNGGNRKVYPQMVVIVEKQSGISHRIQDVSEKGKLDTAD